MIGKRDSFDSVLRSSQWWRQSDVGLFQPAEMHDLSQVSSEAKHCIMYALTPLITVYNRDVKW